MDTMDNTIINCNISRFTVSILRLYQTWDIHRAKCGYVRVTKRYFLIGHLYNLDFVHVWAML